MLRLRTLLAAGLAVGLALSLSFTTRAQDDAAEPEASKEAEAPAEPEETTLEQILREAKEVRPMLKSEMAKRFVDSAESLPEITDERIVYYRRADRAAMTPDQYAEATEEEREGFDEASLGERFYYFNRYGTPISYARPLDLVAPHGLESIEEKNIIDFGWGGIGQVRMMASIGASVTGIEVDQLDEAFYREPMDVGDIPRAKSAGVGPYGHLRLLYGQYPSDEALARRVGAGFHLFLSKNVLKRGYIHPEAEANPAALIDLGVTDEEFVTRIYNTLNPGGVAMIYNLHPAQAPEGETYIPWADGRCPFDVELLTKVGFDVIAYNKDDSAKARTFAKKLKWDEQGMDIENNLFATYTLFQRPLRN